MADCRSTLMTIPRLTPGTTEGSPGTTTDVLLAKNFCVILLGLMQSSSRKGLRRKAFVHNVSMKDPHTMLQQCATAG